MARSTSQLPRWRQRLAAYRWRRVGVLAGISLGLSLAVVLYLFGTDDHLFSRVLSAFFVGFWLLTVTFLGILPFIGWAAQHWFGRGWENKEAVASRSRPAPAARRITRSPS
ncbi:MAG: hypothetical protein ACRYFX_29465 [Janthinobacterium lividum]